MLVTLLVNGYCCEVPSSRAVEARYRTDAVARQSCASQFDAGAPAAAPSGLRRAPGGADGPNGPGL
jgi:hypothetical protein